MSMEERLKAKTDNLVTTVRRLQDKVVGLSEKAAVSDDVLRTVPGFEGDRLESNGWFVESIARGQPRTLLVLLNGVNITEAVRRFP